VWQVEEGFSCQRRILAEEELGLKLKGCPAQRDEEEGLFSSRARRRST
jgi:hypothetical protein